MDINQLLAFSAAQGASDLHLSAGLPPMLRIDGDVTQVNLPDQAAADVAAMIEATFGDGESGAARRAEWQQQLECDYSYELPGSARFRVNAFVHSRGPGAVFRTIPSQVLSLEELGLGETFKRLAQLPRGLVLVTGPTGSGKSTTLAALIDYINNSRQNHILTIEDPIEFVHQSNRCLINQREVHRDTHSFSAALRSALREDPDVILVGELRDLETIRLALTAAETGHLVFATLHTASAAKTIDRIVDVFPAAEKSMVRSMLSESLQAVVSQTLLKKIGGGRAAAHEILIGTSAVRNMIREDKIPQIYSALQSGAAVGMQTLDQHLLQLVNSGVIEPAVAAVQARAPEVFQ